MNKKIHSPAPWIVRGKNYEGHIMIGKSLNNTLTYAHARYISEDRTEEQAANATLIAAAPELLQQLDHAFSIITLLNEIIFAHGIKDTYANSPKQREDIEKIIAVMKKAEGIDADEWSVARDDAQ